MAPSTIILEQVTVLLCVAGAMGALFSMVRLPAVLAFILAGVIIGPGGFGLIKETATVNTIAQLGIIFLLFVLGAELNMPRLKELRIHTIWAGILQLSTGIIAFSALLLLAGVGLKPALFMGGALSLSSTAIVLKMLMDQGEDDSVHGRMMMGILIIQDLALVPLMMFMPLLTGNLAGQDLLNSIGLVLAKTIVVLGSVVALSWRFMPRIIDRIAAVSSKEIFAVTVVAFGLLIAILSQLLGIGFAVGAFVAGLCLSRSLSSRQIIADSLPFRDIFSTIFFASVGMLLNVPFFISHWPQTLLAVLVILVVKALTISLSVSVFRFPIKTVVWCGLSLFQVGEFSFILLQTGLSSGTLDSEILNTLTTAIILTLLATPLVIRNIPRILKRLFRHKKWLASTERAKSGAKATIPVILGGYGPIAKNIAHMLDAHDIGYCVVEMNIKTVEALQHRGIPCVFGDASNLDVLSHAGLAEARVFAVTVPDVRSAELALQNAKKLNPHLYTIVRTRYQHPIKTLFDMGADEVIYEEFETSMSFIHAILGVFGDDITDRESYMLLLRENRKALHQSGRTVDDQVKYGRFSVFKDTKIEWIAIPEGSPLVGKTIADAALRQETGVNILSLLEPGGEELTNPDPSTVLRAHQVIVVIGTLSQLNQLEGLLG